MQLSKLLSPSAANLTRRQFCDDLKSIFAESRDKSLSATNNKRHLFGLVNTNLTHYNGPFLDPSQKEVKNSQYFNCSQDYNGENPEQVSITKSFADKQPDRYVVEILTRNHRCDIGKMFHQVHVNPEHRDLLRFLWWEENDLSISVSFEKLLYEVLKPL